MVQPKLVKAIAHYLVDEGTIFLQSDVEAVAQEMGEHFLAHASFEKQHQDSWLADNPFPIETEREIATFNKKEPVYRLLLKKTKSDNQ